MDSNLFSLKKFENDVESMKLLSFLLKPDQKEQLKHLEQQLHNMTMQIDLFNKNFSDHGWCAYDSMNFILIETANNAFETGGLGAGEDVLLEYYTKQASNDIRWLKVKSQTFVSRYDLIQKAFEDHVAARYYASIPLFLLIIDGSINDYTQSKGFFAEGTDLTAWDCLVGCSNGLIKLKDIFNKGRNKTNNDEIRLPYRNGILHGRDLNYGNKYVSCKCVALMFALADWMQMKDSETRRKEKYDIEMNPPPILQSIQKLKKIQNVQHEISKWNARTVIVGETISASGNIDDYVDFPYILPLIKAFLAWERKNYGELSILLKNLFTHEKSAKKRAGECRSLFQSKDFISFKLKEIEERACSLSRVLVQVDWNFGDKRMSKTLEFGCVYQSENGEVALPWRDNGMWIIMPWNVRGLYKM